jgi:propanediol dehydratase large subunit
MQYRVSKKMSTVKLSAEAFRKNDQRVLKNMYSNNSSVATSSAVSVCARLLVRLHTCSKFQICTYNSISNQSRFFHGSIVFTPKFLA